MVNVVTGGAGFIGGHLVRQLLGQGERVRVLDVNIPEELPPGVEVLRGSVTSVEQVRRALEGARAVYHLAGNPHLWSRDRGAFYQTNQQGTGIVLSEAARAGVERVVHTSSMTVLLGKRSPNGRTTVDERTSLAVEDMLGDYCRSKILAEQEALAWADKGLPVVVVTPTLPVGPGDRNLTPPSRMILNIVNGRTPAYLESQFNLIDVRDVAAGHIAARQRGRIGERYILGHRNLRFSELLALLGDVTGLPMPRRRIPYALAFATGLVSEAVANVTGRPPMAPLTGVRLAGRQVAYDTEKARAELGLPQSSLRQALFEQVAWMWQRGLVTRQLPVLAGEACVAPAE